LGIKTTYWAFPCIELLQLHSQKCKQS